MGSICEHGRERHRCKECGGGGICEHGRQRSQCKECGGVSNLRARSSAPQVQGVRWVRQICEHGRERSLCKECGGSGICKHGRHRQSVQGVRWVWNLRARSCSAIAVRSAAGPQICEHGRERHRCKDSAVGLGPASTVVALYVQGMRRGLNLRARSCTLSVQGVSRRELMRVLLMPILQLAIAVPHFPRYLARNLLPPFPSSRAFQPLQRRAPLLLARLLLLLVRI